LTEFDKAYWNKYWADKMPWDEFVTQVNSPDNQPRILAAKLGMALRPTYFKWAKRAREEITGEVRSSQT
jgi:hypothetical protein